MSRKKLPRIRTPKETYTMDYPMALELAETQEKILWTVNEIHIEKDLHDLKLNLTEAELHGVTTVLKLFTKYELHVGRDYWLDRVRKVFPRPDIDRMAAVFGYVEINVHAPFYNKINEILGLATDEFYESYKESKVLVERINWIHDIVSLPRTNELDNLKSLAAFAFVEGAVLYSSFAFLKHFQVEGKNLLANLVAGINFSVRDENPLIAGTEVLTTRGWVPIENISIYDIVAQYDMESGSIVYGHPLSTVSSESKVSYEFKGKDFHQHVSPKHRMVTTNGIIRAEDTTGKEEYIISGKLNNKYQTRLHDEDKKNLDKKDMDWLYAKLRFVDYEWVREAFDYYVMKHKKKDDIIDLFTHLMGGVYKYKKFQKQESTKIKKVKHNHKKPVNFHCLIVPTGAFVIRSNGHISITGNCHAEADAWLFHTLKKECKELGIITEQDEEHLKEVVYDIARNTYEHEAEIIKMIIEKGTIRGITANQLEYFVQSRIDLVLEYLGYPKLFKPKYNPIKDWFYQNINAAKMHDFFAIQGSEYNRDWVESDFVWGQVND